MPLIFLQSTRISRFDSSIIIQNPTPTPTKTFDLTSTPPKHPNYSFGAYETILSSQIFWRAWLLLIRSLDNVVYQTFTFPTRCHQTTCLCVAYLHTKQRAFCKKIYNFDNNLQRYIHQLPWCFLSFKRFDLAT